MIKWLKWLKWLFYCEPSQFRRNPRYALPGMVVKNWGEVIYCGETRFVSEYNASTGTITMTEPGEINRIFDNQLFSD